MGIVHIQKGIILLITLLAKQQEFFPFGNIFITFPQSTPRFSRSGMLYLKYGHSQPHRHLCRNKEQAQKP